MALGLLEWIATISAILLGAYYYLMSYFNFWRSRGVPGPNPVLLFGNLRDVFTARTTWADYFMDLQAQYPDEPMVGIYASQNPGLVVYDLEIIKAILIKDFSNFVDRDINREPFNPLAQHLFSLESKRWRPLRSKLSPVFTSGKLRDMFYLLNQCGDQLEKYLEQFDGECIDMRDIAARFTTDTIGLCAFGVEAKSLEKEDSIFRTMGKRVFLIDRKRSLKMQLSFFLPPLYKIVGKWLEDNPLTDFFIGLTRDTMQYRKDNNIRRHDFIDLLRSLKEEPSKVGDMELTDSLLAAQLFVFFAAGFETSSSTISNCLFELAMNHDIQDKLRAEIREEVDGAGVTYDGIKRMKYLDMVVKETLRKYSPVPILNRMAEKDCTIPGTTIKIPATTKILIPVHAIQRSAKHYPDPDTFNPENFSEEAVKKRHPMAFLAFGDGPRNCIGARFGTVQTKVGLVKILQKFCVDVCDKTDKNYEIDPKAFLLTPKNGIVVKLTMC